MATTSDSKFNFWVNYLKFVSLFFAAMGVMWAVLGSFDPFGMYEKEMAQSFYNKDELPTAVVRTFRFIMAPFGATAAGYFILQYFIAKNAFAKRELWGWQAIMFAFFFWFILDTSMSALRGAWFNIVLANIPSLIAMLPIIFTRKYFKTNLVE